ncbi:LysM peptidoglycan-binding domain-containing protein [Nakamurella sp.]|uniref:LysM peptidoglycan-binding domain-containing protein n=1 Tax=Nakamurella sp. TaxID=1869182 RepID=UPI003B3A778D
MGEARRGRLIVTSGRRLAPPAGGEGYRIGRWERLALTVLVGATLVLLAIRLLGALMAGPEASTDITVKPGDTLWSIATDAAPDRDPRAVIDEIRRLNQVTGDLVRAGEVLRVPASPDQGSAG